jgi:hypothetical protein
MKEFVQRFDPLASTQVSSYIGILFSCLTGILLVGIPFDLVASKVVNEQLVFLSQFISWLLLFSGGALLAAVGAWCSYLATPGHRAIRLRPIIAVSEITALAIAIISALILSRFPTVLGTSLFGYTQPHIILFFVGVLIITASASSATWRTGHGLTKAVAMAVRLSVLGVLAEATLATVAYLVFSLFPNL